MDYSSSEEYGEIRGRWGRTRSAAGLPGKDWAHHEQRNESPPNLVHP